MHMKIPHNPPSPVHLPNLHAEMGRYGVTAVQLAHLLGMSRAGIRRRLTGETVLTAEEMRRIRDRYFAHISLDYLLCHEPALIDPFRDQA